MDALLGKTGWPRPNGSGRSRKSDVTQRPMIRCHRDVSIGANPTRSIAGSRIRLTTRKEPDHPSLSALDLAWRAPNSWGSRLRTSATTLTEPQPLSRYPPVQGHNSVG